MDIVEDIRQEIYKDLNEEQKYELNHGREILEQMFPEINVDAFHQKPRNSIKDQNQVRQKRRSLTMAIVCYRIEDIKFDQKSILETKNMDFLPFRIDSQRFMNLIFKDFFIQKQFHEDIKKFLLDKRTNELIALSFWFCFIKQTQQIQPVNFFRKSKLSSYLVTKADMLEEMFIKQKLIKKAKQPLGAYEGLLKELALQMKEHYMFIFAFVVKVDFSHGNLQHRGDSKIQSLIFAITLAITLAYVLHFPQVIEMKTKEEVDYKFNRLFSQNFLLMNKQILGIDVTDIFTNKMIQTYSGDGWNMQGLLGTNVEKSNFSSNLLDNVQQKSSSNKKITQELKVKIVNPKKLVLKQNFPSFNSLDKKKIHPSIISGMQEMSQRLDTLRLTPQQRFYSPMAVRGYENENEAEDQFFKYLHSLNGNLDKDGQLGNNSSGLDLLDIRQGKQNDKSIIFDQDSQTKQRFNPDDFDRTFDLRKKKEMEKWANSDDELIKKPQKLSKATENIKIIKVIHQGPKERRKEYKEQFGSIVKDLSEKDQIKIYDQKLIRQRVAVLKRDHFTLIKNMI